MRCSSFHYIVPCFFEIILMPESSLQECYMMLSAVCYQNLVICLFHCILCVHPMSMSSTCVFSYIMPSLQWCHPCIFVILVLSASSSWSRVLAVAVFLTDSVIIWCYVNLLLQAILCLIWRCSLRIFCYKCHSLSIHAPGCIYSPL